MTLKKIRQLIEIGKYSIRPHTIQHGLKEGFTMDHVIEAIMNGKEKPRICSECHTQTTWEKIPLDFHRQEFKIKISDIRAMVCPNCGEIYLPREIAGDIWAVAEKMLSAAEASKARAPDLGEYTVFVS